MDTPHSQKKGENMVWQVLRASVPCRGFFSTSPINPGGNLHYQKWPGMVSFKTSAKLTITGSAAPSLLTLSKAFS